MTIHSTFSWRLIFNCSPENRERKGWQQFHFEANFNFPFVFKRESKYYGEKKERGYDKKTHQPIEIDVWDDHPRQNASDNDRLIEKIIRLPLIVITNTYLTEFGAKRNIEMREYFDNEIAEREKEYDEQNIKS